MTDEAADQLGRAIDAVDNLAHALLLPMDADFHVKALKEALPHAVAGLKAAYVALTGNNPWE